MKIERTCKALKNNASSTVVASLLLQDVIDEVEITKGAMILDGYDEEDSCINYMNDLIKELKNVRNTYMVSKECRKQR